MDCWYRCRRRHASDHFGFNPLPSRPTTHLFFHGPRWALATLGGQSPPAFCYTAYHYYHHWHHRRILLLSGEHWRTGGPHKRRHVICLHPGCRRHHYPATHRSAAATPIPDPIGPLGAVGRDYFLRLFDDRA